MELLSPEVRGVCILELLKFESAGFDCRRFLSYSPEENTNTGREVGKSGSPEVRGSSLKVLERNSPGRKYNESQEDQKRIQVK